MDTTQRLSKQELDELEEAFFLFDKNNDGQLDVKELGSVMRYLGMNPTEEQILEMIKEVDKDDSHTLDYEEYRKFIQSHRKSPTEERQELVQAFSRFDKTKKGYVDLEELRRILLSLGNFFTLDEAKEIADLVDVNKDGKVQIEELVEFLMSDGKSTRKVKG